MFRGALALGCCFVEENCEAMLSRLAGVCLRQRQLTSFRHHLNLWLTLANVNAAPKGTRGHLRKELVHLFRLRVRRLVSNAAGAPFIHAANRLVQQAWPEDFHMPSPLPENSDVDQLETESEHPMVPLAWCKPIAMRVI